MTVTEPRFTRAEVDLLIASRRRDQEPRGAHGYTIAEATDPANQYAFEVPLPTTDFAQDALNRAKESYRKRYKDADMSALLFKVIKSS